MKKNIFILVFLVFICSNFSFSTQDAKEAFYLNQIKNYNNIEAMVSLASLYYFQGKLELAEKYYLMAIKNNSSDAMFNLGLLYDEQGKYDLAEKYYLMGVKHNDSDSMYNLGVLYYNQEKYQTAKNYFLMAEKFGNKEAAKILRENF